MNQVTLGQIEVDTLNQKYIKYIEGLRAEWISHNRINSGDVYEVMRPEQQTEVHRRIAQWDYYITPLAEAWWKKQGYEVVWPDDNSKPMKVCKL